MATDRLFNQTQGDSLLAILAQIRDGYNSVDGAFSLTSENPLQNKKITGAVTDTIETLGGTAQKSYVIGQYFLANDGYYYVTTAAITAGSSNISSSTGGNCSKTCITAAMNNLSSQISNLKNVITNTDVPTEIVSSRLHAVSTKMATLPNVVMFDVILTSTTDLSVTVNTALCTFTGVPTPSYTIDLQIFASNDNSAVFLFNGNGIYLAGNQTMKAGTYRCHLVYVA